MTDILQPTAPEEPIQREERNPLLTKPVRYAKFNSRMFAAIIDIFFIMVVAIPISEWITSRMYLPVDLREFVAYAQGPHTQSELIDAFMKTMFQQRVIEKIIVSNVLQTLCIAAYILPFWFKRQSTPGKMIIGIEIRDATTLELMTPKQSIRRFLGYMVSGIPFTLGFLWMIFTKKRQGWHDKIAHTVVVVKEKKETVSEAAASLT